MHTHGACEEHRVLVARERVQVDGPVRAEADATNGCGAELVHATPEHPRAATRGLQIAREQAKEAGLAGPVGAHDDDGFAGRGVQIHTLQRITARREAIGESPCANHRRHSGFHYRSQPARAKAQRLMRMTIKAIR